MNPSRLLVAAFAFAVVAAPVSAQGRRPGLGLGASLGANVPSGEFNDGAKPGAVANAFLELRPSEIFALRGSLFWSRSDIDNPLIRSSNGNPLPDVSSNRITGDVNLIGASADAEFAMGAGILQPYLIGGVGAYHRRVAQNIDGTIEEFQALRKRDTQVGFNGGLGVRFNLLGAGLFLESRYYSVRTKPDATNFIPVTLGVVF
jgi:hypothetical protein